MARAALAALALAGVGTLAFAGAGVASTTAPSVPAAQPAAVGTASIPPGYTRVSTGNLSAPAGTQARGSIGCPAGTVVFGGSVFTLSTSLRVNVNSTFPQRNGWTAFVNNGSDAAVLYEITAICGTKPAHYKVVRAASVASRSGTQTAAHATCPTGAKPLSGGVLSSSSSPFVDVSSTYPQGQTWRVVETNAS